MNSRARKNAFPGTIRETASESVPDWPTSPKPPVGAPNVIIVLVDDLGFSDISPYGAEIATPHVEGLAESGYLLTNYYTAPVCSPARASLMTGLNPHFAGFSTVAHGDPGYPNSRLELPEDAPTIAESFQAAGYATFMVGKWHLTKESKLHDGATKESWPCQRGFDRYYGCMDAFTQLFHPHRLIRDNSPVPIDQYPEDYFLTDDLTDQAVDMIRTLKASDAERPFFLYYSHHAVHAPLQAKPADMDKYRGMYEAGWGEVRHRRFSEQLRRGLFPEGTALPKASEPGYEVAPWEELDEDERLRFARYMEVYAAAVDNVDQNLGRLIEYLRASEQYDNTIIVFTSDNGASGEGGSRGTRSYLSKFIDVPQPPADWEVDVPSELDLLGGAFSSVHYPRGWASVSNTPFRFYKGHTFNGGVRAPLVVSWPSGLPRRTGDDGLRNQFAYVSDVGQTVLNLAGVPMLRGRKNIDAHPPHGRSFAPWLRDASAPQTRSEQYSEFLGHRFYISKGWKLVTLHPFGTKLTDDEWELYDLNSDPTETRNIASQYPEMVSALSSEWLAAAWENQVFPIDDGSMSWFRPDTEGVLEKPIVLERTLAPMERYRSSKLTNLRSFVITARVESGNGVLVAHGDQSGGYVIFVEDNMLCLTYNEYGRCHRLREPMDSAAEANVEVHFNSCPDFRWEITILIDGQEKARLGPVMALFGLAPMTGISVAADQGGPVDAELAARRGHFPWTEEHLRVAYHPGAKADYNTEVLVALKENMERVFD
ncbi:arylsulfatase [Arthrobacter sp. CAU 1506]|uniref:arylsulfatase n=1 Tax=Arthrobacter sp. CAU 1506 TaxID=2560052 RepID=UPI0010AD5665|nr:arylsulfatase [Arthrobacter sp. CAU 1506]TJY66276.1 arylsulfatase [Arthrobacter sp. CAU 1506]